MVHGLRHSDMRTCSLATAAVADGDTWSASFEWKIVCAVCAARVQCYYSITVALGLGEDAYGSVMGLGVASAKRSSDLQTMMPVANAGGMGEAFRMHTQTQTQTQMNRQRGQIVRIGIRWGTCSLSQ